MHRRPLSALIAAALTVATIASGSAANAATPSGTAPLTRAAAEARADASAALAGLRIPAATAGISAASASGAKLEVPLDSVVPIKVATKRYDIHIRSTGAKSDRTTIRLYLGTHEERVSIRRLVRVTVTRHGYTHPLLATTTTFRRFVVMLTGLQSSPLGFKAPHFATRSAFIAALTHGLAIDSREVTREYGALLRFAQMSLDLSASLLQAAQYLNQHPAVTDLSAAPTVQTTAGSGGYAGSVTLTGTLQAFTASVVNTTDTTSLTESVDAKAFTMTYTVGGRTYTESISFTG